MFINSGTLCSVNMSTEYKNTIFLQIPVQVALLVACRVPICKTCQ